MKIRALDQLEAALTEDLKWRKNELQMWESVVTNCRAHEATGLLRGGLALLYAHWEGYVKTAGGYYLEYVSRKGLHLGQLRPELAAVALRADIARLAESKKPEDHTVIVNKLREGSSIPADLPYGAVTIRTYANLNFETFSSIMHSLGCDASPHKVHQFLIDNRLLRARNEIAHGREEVVELDDWMTIRARVEDILGDVRVQLSNAGATSSYRVEG